MRLGNSMAVVLPMDWVREHNIEQRDELEVRYDGIITIRAPRKDVAHKEEPW